MRAALHAFLMEPTRQKDLVLSSSQILRSSSTPSELPCAIFHSFLTLWPPDIYHHFWPRRMGVH